MDWWLHRRLLGRNTASVRSWILFILYFIMEIYLVRHIDPAIEKGICYGQLDVAIPDDYHMKHQHIKNELPDDFDAIFSSPLLRCKQLAERISNNVIYDNRLMEVNFGDWEGKKWDEINQLDLNTWMNNYITAAPPNGESLTDVLNRFSDFIAEIKTKYHNKVLIVAHAGIIRCAMNLFDDVAIDKIMMEKVSFGGISKFNVY